MVERGGTPRTRRARTWGALAATAALLTTLTWVMPAGAAPRARAPDRSTATDIRHRVTTAGGGSQRTIIPLANFALPPGGWGCAPRHSATNGSTTLPVTVSKVGTQVAILTNVCIGGSAPLPFVIDTGASESIVDPRVAAMLHLRTAGQQQRIEGVGCSGPAQQLHVATWSWEGVALNGQVLWGVHIPAMGGAGQPVGLLGSDVLSRFGAVRFDFADGTVILPGGEGPAPQQPHTVNGPTATRTPRSLLAGRTLDAVPAKVITGPGLAEVIADVRIGSHDPTPWAVDTGSSQSVVERSLRGRFELRPTNVWERQTTVCSTITSRLYGSGPWAVGKVALVRGPIATVNLGPVGSAGFVGLLGSDQLAHFPWVVFDYAGGRLVLGAA